MSDDFSLGRVLCFLKNAMFLILVFQGPGSPCTVALTEIVSSVGKSLHVVVGHGGKQVFVDYL